MMADDLDVELASDVARIRMALAEAGYPSADVYVEWSGIFVDGVPAEVVDRKMRDLKDAQDTHAAILEMAGSLPDGGEPTVTERTDP
jgi:hypothetical protein